MEGYLFGIVFGLMVFFIPGSFLLNLFQKYVHRKAAEAHQSTVLKADDVHVTREKRPGADFYLIQIKRTDDDSPKSALG